MKSFYSEKELSKIGFKSYGNNVLISRKSSFYGVNRISLGNDVRIDDFCVLSAGAGGIEIGNYVHIAIYSSLQGDGKIVLQDFVGISSKVSIYSSNDDYLGEYLSNPTVPSKYTNVLQNGVILNKHVLIGSGSIILPGVHMKIGSVLGALSLANKDCEEFFIYKGNPAQKFLKRSKKLLDLEKEFLKYESDHIGVGDEKLPI